MGSIKRCPDENDRDESRAVGEALGGRPVRRPVDQPMSILVVDDEESIRRYVDRVLSGAGYRTTMAVSGADAIAAAARRRAGSTCC